MFFYKSQRVGKNGRKFNLYKVRTLKQTDSQFASEETYLPFGRLLRKTKLDELPQLWNIIRGDIAIVGPRAEEQRTIDVLPKDIREKLLSVKPGLTSPASLHFFGEEKILQLSDDPAKTYWEQIKPLKVALDIWYIDNRCFVLDCALVFMTFFRVLGSFLKK